MSSDEIGAEVGDEDCDLSRECTAENIPHRGCFCSDQFDDSKHVLNEECTAENTPYTGCLCSDQFDDSGVTCTQRDCTDVDTPYTGCNIADCTTGVDAPYTGCNIADCTAVDQPYPGCIYTYTKIDGNRPCQKISEDPSVPLFQPL